MHLFPNVRLQLLHPRGLRLKSSREKVIADKPSTGGLASSCSGFRM